VITEKEKNFHLQIKSTLSFLGGKNWIRAPFVAQNAFNVQCSWVIRLESILGFLKSGKMWTGFI
jgi:hypothetical protein